MKQFLLQRRFGPSCACVAMLALGGGSLVVAASASAALMTSAGAGLGNGRIVGHVRECNTPTTCVVQPFTVSARNAAGAIVAHTTTTGHNYFALRVAPGRYALSARAAGGLTCHASATAVAGETAHQTITCLVP